MSVTRKYAHTPTNPFKIDIQADLLKNILAPTVPKNHKQKVPKNNPKRNHHMRDHSVSQYTNSKRPADSQKYIKALNRSK